MKTEIMQANEWLEELHLDGMLETVSKLCQDRNISLYQFYEQNRTFLDSTTTFQKRSPGGKRYPLATPTEVEKRILELSDQRPLSGCGQIEQLINIEGKRCSKPTIQKILERNGRGTRYDRLLLLEARYLEQKIEITPKQLTLLEKTNPCLRERLCESQRPGEILCQDIIPVNGLNSAGKVYLHAVVDTFCSYAFGYLNTNEPSAHAVGLLKDRVLPFYEKLGLKVGAIRTGSSRIFVGKSENPYKDFLRLSDIKQIHECRVPRKSGFIERFQSTVMDEFFKTIPQASVYTAIADLQKNLDIWLYHYNNGRPHRGYRNMGQYPYASIVNYLANSCAGNGGETRD